MAKRVILYARVSTDEQATRGYSIAGQLDELRATAKAEGLTIVEEVVDPGYSRSTLERPGLDRVREMVAEGKADMVLAWRRDRFGAAPIPLILSEEFKAANCRMRALDSAGEGDDAEFLGEIKDAMSKLELRTTATRTRLGKIRKARQGKLIASKTPDYGFKFNADRDGYEINEEEMKNVRRIFHALADGVTQHTLINQLNLEGVPPPGGTTGISGRWNRKFIRVYLVPDDVYKPHTYEEIAALVDKDVAARLDPEKNYGIFWYNRYKTRTVRRLVDDGNGSKKKRNCIYKTERPRDEWIAIPVPDAGIPLEVVEAARAGLKTNVNPAKRGDRYFELTGGIARCGECGRAFKAQTTTSKKSSTYYYYRCANVRKQGPCTNTKQVPADKLETQVAGIVSELLADEDRLLGEIDALIEKERSALARPEAEAKAWAGQIAECARRRDKYQEMYADDLLTADELRAKLKDLDERKAEAERELAAADTRLARIAELERDRAALAETFKQRALDGGLSAFTPEQCREIYRRLKLTVHVYPDQTARVTGDVPLAVGYLDQGITMTHVQHDEEGYGGFISFCQNGHRSWSTTDPARPASTSRTSPSGA